MKASNPDLDANVFRAPDKVELYLDYAKWLKTQGDPRAQLISVQARICSQEKVYRQNLFAKRGASWVTDLADSLGLTEIEIFGLGGVPEDFPVPFDELTSVANSKERSREDKLLRKYESTWLGKLAGHVSVTWHLGFIRSVEISGREKHAISTYRALLELPVARFVREIKFAVPSHGPIIHELIRTSPMLLDRLVLAGMGESRGESCDLEPLYAALPNLRALAVVIRAGGMRFGRMRLPKLREFEVITEEGLTEDNLNSLTQAEFPALESLKVDFAPQLEDEAVENVALASLRPLLNKQRFPRLKLLSLSGAPWADKLVSALAKSKVLEQLWVLELPGSNSDSGRQVTDVGAGTILDNKAAFAHLKFINLAQNDISEKAGARLSRALKLVNLAWQAHSLPGYGKRKRAEVEASCEVHEASKNKSRKVRATAEGSGILKPELERLVVALTKQAKLSVKDIKRYTAHALPAYRLLPKKCNLAKLPIGASRLGGVPDVPKGFEWPRFDDRPLTFLAQINLSTLKSPELPSEGWLLFFYDAVEMPWEDLLDAKGRPSSAVRYIVTRPEQELVRTSSPKAKRTETFTVCALETQETLSLPFPYDLAEAYTAGEEGKKARDFSSYCDALAKLESGQGCVSRLLGHERPQQHGYDMRDQFPKGRGRWRLLLELGYYGHQSAGPEWCWADAGSLYFWIPEIDLKAAKFEQVSTVLQC